MTDHAPESLQATATAPRGSVHRNVRLYWANPDKFRERSRRWYSVNREKAKVRHSKWTAKNLEKIRAYQRRRYAANPEKFGEQVRLWRQKNPEKYRAMRKRYYAANRERIIANNNRYSKANHAKIAARERLSRKKLKLNYVKKLIGIWGELPEPLIDLKRKQIQITRALDTLKKGQSNEEWTSEVNERSADNVGRAT